MRVIAGSAKHLNLKTIEGHDTRPTTDRIKETLFNMLQTDIPGCRFLDLFSGSGAIGIEALSRGAREAVFVESNPKAAACIRENLQFTQLQEHAEVLQTDVFQALGRLAGRGAYDFIFMDPPYNHEWEKQVLRALQNSDLVDAYTVLIVEASLETGFSWVESMGYKIKKYKKYKTNAHVFIEKKSSDDAVRE